MKQVLIIFKKEFKDVLRDKRAVFTMIGLPLILYPALFFIIFNVTKSQVAKAASKELHIAWYDYGQGERLEEKFSDELLIINQFDAYQQFRMMMDKGEKIDSFLTDLIRSEKLDGAIILDPSFDSLIDSLKSPTVTIYHKSTDDQGITRRRIQLKLEVFREEILRERYEATGLDESFVEVLNDNYKDISTEREQGGNIIGGILPYFFIIFCFMGSMYPAIDLAAGEKERGTIETILTAPASNLQILLGKMGVVVIAGIVSSMISFMGILFVVSSTDVIPSTILDTIYGFLQPGSLALVFLMLVPLAIFFASLLLSLSIYSKSYKEAQSLITPFIMVILVPAIIGMLPGTQLNYVTGLIPVLNVTLATKQIMAESVSFPLILETVISLLLLAIASLMFSIKWFSKESNILRA